MTTLFVGGAMADLRGCPRCLSTGCYHVLSESKLIARLQWARPLPRAPAGGRAAMFVYLSKKIAIPHNLQLEARRCLR